MLEPSASLILQSSLLPRDPLTPSLSVTYHSSNRLLGSSTSDLVRSDEYYLFQILSLISQPVLPARLLCGPLHVGTDQSLSAIRRRERNPLADHTLAFWDEYTAPLDFATHGRAWDLSEFDLFVIDSFGARQWAKRVLQGS